MPGRKCKASRLPEGRSRKQARQEHEEEHEDRRSECPGDRRPGRSLAAGLRARGRALRGQRQRRQLMRHRARAVVAGGSVAVAWGHRRGRRRQRGPAARGCRGLLGPETERAVRCATMRPRRFATVTCMGHSPRR